MHPPTCTQRPPSRSAPQSARKALKAYAGAAVKALQQNDRTAAASQLKRMVQLNA